MARDIDALATPGSVAPGGRRYPRGVTTRLDVALEGTGRKVFASAQDWPGWSRSGKTPEAAIEALLTYAARYEPIARAAGLPFPSTFDVPVMPDQHVGPAIVVHVGDADRVARLVPSEPDHRTDVAHHQRRGPHGGPRDADVRHGGKGDGGRRTRRRIVDEPTRGRAEHRRRVDEC